MKIIINERKNKTIITRAIIETKDEKSAPHDSFLFAQNNFPELIDSGRIFWEKPTELLFNDLLKKHGGKYNTGKRIKCFS
ncbi:MAG: hypothetical protein LLG05_12495 [Porphyromonadaceae bacterium]|nr:hypothetical protein [Porphyromonadaceae bacterium]